MFLPRIPAELSVKTGQQERKLRDRTLYFYVRLGNTISMTIPVGELGRANPSGVWPISAPLNYHDLRSSKCDSAFDKRTQRETRIDYESRPGKCPREISSLGNPDSQHDSFNNVPAPSTWGSRTIGSAPILCVTMAVEGFNSYKMHRHAVIWTVR